ncbi:MAG: type II secretion system GspH family protein [Lentisphaeraceae bacterium]|nr:type II secretion system GspH family protein [Lentisphaeraceae bacterium]
MKTKFTLIELLIVIAMIAILASILLPSLTKSRDLGRLSVCLSNLSQSGKGYSLLHNDNNKFYAKHSDWVNIHGQVGQNPRVYSAGPSAELRPLNAYLPVDVAECPSDKGEYSRWSQGTNLFTDYGTSYFVPWKMDGNVATMFTSHPTEPRRVTFFDHLDKKMIMADWVWQCNRPLEYEENRWHMFSNRRQANVLFGDGHASFFTFPTLDSRTHAYPVNLDLYEYY